MLKLGSGENQVTCKGLIDTGNTITEETAIEAELHKQLQVGFSCKGGKPIGTADKQCKLIKLGVSNPIPIHIHGIGRFEVKPAVIKSLSDPFNIGNGFLESIGKQVPTSLSFEGKNVILKVGQNETELMRPMMSENQQADGQTPTEQQDHVPPVREVDVTSRRTMNRNPQRIRDQGPTRKQPIRAKEERICNGNSVTFIEVLAEKNFKENQEVLVENEETNQMETVGALYKWKKEGNRVAIINHAGTPIRIPKHSVVGYVSEAEVEAQTKESYLEKINSVSEEHRLKVVEDLGLMQNPVLKANPEIQKKATQLVMEFADIFSGVGTKEVGRTDLIEFEIKLKKGATPVKQKLRPLNPHQKESLKKQMEKWKQEGIIQESISPWASPMVPAKKAGGAPGEIRWAIDYRALNEATVSDSYPIPNVEEILERLAGSKYYSALDASCAFHVIPVAQKTRPLLAFITPMGLFEFCSMPFGPKNSGSVYARFVDMLLQRIRSQNVVAYIDDVLVFTKDLDHHLTELRSVFELHRLAGIKLRPTKTKLFTESTKYLGFDVSQKGISMRKSFVERVLEWPRPKTTRQLRTFLGFTSYYRSFIADYSNLTCEMNGVRMQKKLEWTDVMEKKFNILKQKFAEYPLRSYPRYDVPEPFQVTTDWSQKNIAGILSQVQEGQERFIAAHGRKCSKHEANYPSTKGELAAVIAMCRKWDHILKYRKFILNTDSRALKYLQTLKQPTGIWFRWLQELQAYDFEVKHRPGKENLNADNMSRCDHLPEPTKEEMKEAEEEVCTICEKELMQYIEELDDEERIAELFETETPQIREMHQFGRDISIHHVRRAQKEDPIVAEVRTWVLEKRKPENKELKGKEEELKAYAQVVEALELKDDILYYPYTLNEPGGQKTYRLVMPESVKDAVFYWSHQSETAGHFGQTATVQRANNKFYYPGMSTDLKQRVSNCGDCLAKRKKVNLKDGVHHPQQSGYPGQRIYVDLVGPLPETKNVERFVLTVEDGFTRHANAYPLRNKEAATVARVLMDEYCSEYGFPQEIHSDNGGEFVNSIWEELCERLQIKKTTTPTYNPNSNIVERWHRTLNMMMKVFLERDDKEWVKYLPAMVMAYNTKVNSSTGVTPFFATFGREARLPVDLILPTPGEQPVGMNEHVDLAIKRFQRIYTFMRQNQEAVIRRNAKLYTGKVETYAENQKVWYLCPRKVASKPRKLTDEWVGPYKIVKQVAEVLYKIRPCDYEGPEITVHAARLLAYKPNTTMKSRIPVNLRTDDQGDELGEEIHPPRIEVDLDKELGVPVRLAYPEVDIVDIMQGRRPGRQPKTTQQNAQNQTDEDAKPPTDEILIEPDEPGPSRPGPEPTDAEDDSARKRARSDSDGASDREAKAARPGTSGQGHLGREWTEDNRPGKMRQKRTRSQLMKQVEEMRRRAETDTGTETDAPNPKKANVTDSPQASKTKSLFKMLLSSSDDEMLSTMRTLQVDITEDSTIPTKGTKGSAAYDLQCHKNAVIPAHGIAMVPLNIRLAIPADYFLLLLSRSGLARKGVTTLAGVIDSDYRGPVCCLLANSTDEDFILKKGQRCCQGVFLKKYDCEFNKKPALDETDRSTNGFGSTGLQN